MSNQVMFIATLIGLFFLLIVGIYFIFRHSKKIKKQLTTTKAQLNKEIEHQHILKAKLEDIETKIASNRIEDQLTGLPSRQTFQDRLVQTLNQSQRYNFIFALMILDIDGFRVFKNVLGLDACNELLKEVTIRLQSCIRPMDTVSRADGSEFVFIIPQLSKPETAAFVAKRLLEVVAQPFIIQQKEIFLTASIGIAVYPNDGDQVTALVQNADEALMQAKNIGNNSYQYYQKEMHSFSERELSLSSSLHNIKTFNDFIIYYQPWLDTTAKKIICMEAVLQWEHPQFGMIAQQDFIRLAEKSGNMLIIGEWLLRHACLQLKKWRENGFHAEALAINISARQLENPHFTYQVTKILEEMKLKPSDIIFQISEMMIANKFGLVDKSLRFLKRLGAQVCIDHFGTGNISLQNLKGIPMNVLKMDKALTLDINHNPESEAIVKMIIALANTLKVKVVGGGIENEEQKQRLIELGCEVLTGDIICPAVSVVDFTSSLEKKITE